MKLSKSQIRTLANRAAESLAEEIEKAAGGLYTEDQFGDVAGGLEEIIEEALDFDFPDHIPSRDES